MRNRLLMGVTVAALTFAAVPATAQVTVERNDESSWDDQFPADDESYLPEEGARDVAVAADFGNRSFGFGIQVAGGGSANEYGPYGYAQRGYGVYAQWGYRDGYRDRDRGRFSLRAAFDYGRRDGYREGFDAARDGRWDWRDHRYYRSTRGYDRRFGGRDAYDLNYRNGFRAGYEEGYRDGRRRGGYRGGYRGRW
jgi:hypothetical protein